MSNRVHAGRVPDTVPDTIPGAGRRLASTLLATLFLAAFTSTLVAAQSMEAGVVTLPSSHDFETTATLLDEAIAEEGLVLVTTIDHAANAENAGLDLPPTTVFVFGNPQAGTPLMQAARTIALDLPQKMLVWEDDAGDVFVTWRDPTVLATHHGLTSDQGPLPTIAALLETLARTAAGSP